MGPKGYIWLILHTLHCDYSTRIHDAETTINSADMLNDIQEPFFFFSQKPHCSLVFLYQLCHTAKSHTSAFSSSHTSKQMIHTANVHAQTHTDNIKTSSYSIQSPGRSFEVTIGAAKCYTTPQRVFRSQDRVLHCTSLCLFDKDCCVTLKYTPCLHNSARHIHPCTRDMDESPVLEFICRKCTCINKTVSGHFYIGC